MTVTTSRPRPPSVGQWAHRTPSAGRRRKPAVAAVEVAHDKGDGG